MLDFETYIKEQARITHEADVMLANILSKNYENFEQYEEVNKITNLEIAKAIIKRLLDKVSQ